MKKLAVISISLLMAASAQAGLYRWVDDAGNVHFSDKVPAAASKKSHAKINKSGDVMDRVDPSSKQAEIDLKEAKLREAQKLAEIQAIKAEAHAVIQKRDDNLMSTYADETELVSFFESKIKMVQGNTKILEAQKKVLKKKVDKLEQRMEVTKTDASKKALNKKIVNINKTLKQYNQALTENDEQILQLSENYQNDLSRYKELTK